MSEDQNQNPNQEEQQQEESGVTELEMLKGRARLMGLTFSNNIGVDTLRTKIQARLDGQDSQEEEGGTDTETLEEAREGEVNAIEAMARTAMEKSGQKVPERQLTLGEQLHAEQMRLIRCRITNLDPKKKDLPGEVFTVANEYLGTVRKFIPFGEQTDDGFHIPFILYNMMKERKFLSITTKRDRRTGADTPVHRYVAEFSLEVMEPLTRQELAQLAQAQQAAGSIESTSIA